MDGRYVNWFGNALSESVPLSPMSDYETYRARFFTLEIWRKAGFALWDQGRVESMKELDQFKKLQRGWLVY